jgi:drug/metabolite transporter (DMT)-like permease
MYPLLYALGLRSTTPTAACVCEALTPVFSIGFEWLWEKVTATTKQQQERTMKRPVSRTKMTAVLLAVSGSLLMTLHGAWMDHNGDWMELKKKVGGRTYGNLLVCASAAAYALFLSVQRRTLQKGTASVMFLTSWGNVCGAVMLLFVAAASGALNTTELVENYTSSFWYGLIWAALITSVLGYTLEGMANSWSSPTLVAVYNAVQPFGAGIMSYCVMGGKHAASSVEFLSVAMVCTGVFLLREDEDSIDSTCIHSMHSMHSKISKKRMKKKKRNVANTV